MSLKIILPVIAMALVALAAMGTAHLGAEPLAISISQSESLQGALTSVEDLIETETLKIPDPSRLLLLVIGLLFVAIAYHRSWVGYRESKKQAQTS